MRTYLVIADDTVTPAMREAFTKMLQDRGLPFWHWITTLWVIHDSAPGASAQGWARTVAEVWPGKHYWIQEADLRSDPWVSVHPQAGNKWLVDTASAIPFGPFLPPPKKS